MPRWSHTPQQDSFILSFHTAPDAVVFAVRAQTALLAQPWPQELLEAADVCRPVWVQVGQHAPQHVCRVRHQPSRC